MCTRAARAVVPPGVTSPMETHHDLGSPAEAQTARGAFGVGLGRTWEFSWKKTRYTSQVSRQLAAGQGKTTACEQGLLEGRSCMANVSTGKPNPLKCLREKKGARNQTGDRWLRKASTTEGIQTPEHGCRGSRGAAQDTSPARPAALLSPGNWIRVGEQRNATRLGESLGRPS